MNVQGGGRHAGLCVWSLRGEGRGPIHLCLLRASRGAWPSPGAQGCCRCAPSPLRASRRQLRSPRPVTAFAEARRPNR